jgi:hypothetical protein
MNSIFTKFALICAVGFAVSVSGWCASPGGVISGNTNINVNARNVTTIAGSGGNVAKTSIGTVRNSKSNTNVTVDVQNVSNVVTGRGRKGCINIGTKGSDPDCN